MPKDERQRSLDVLGLARNCTKNEIRLAYFKRLLHCFPDADDDTLKISSDNLRLVAVSQAYCNLSDVFDPEDVDIEEVFFKFLQEIFKDESGQLFHVLLQEHEATMCADDEYRCDEDDYDIDIKRDFDKLVVVLKNYKRNGSEIPDELTEEKVFKYRDNLLRLREDSKKECKKQSSKKGKIVQNPVAKPKPKSKKQLLAEQRRREKEMANIAVELEKKKKEDEEKEKVRKQLEVEKQKRLEEERKKSEAEARRQREREQKERERLQKLEQEREKKQKEEEERRKKEELKRKKLEQERIEKEKLEKAAKIKAAQSAKEKEEQAKNINKNQNIKRNLTQRSDQTYPREIPPRFQRMSRMKQQQQTTFPQQQQMSSVSPVLPQQSVSSTATTATTVYPSQGMLLTKPVAKPAPPIVGKKKDQERWTKGDYTGIIEDVQDDAGWSNAPPAVSSEDWDDTSEDWGYEVTSLEDKPADDERVIVDKTDQDSWPSMQSKDEKEGFVSDEKENKSTFGDTLDAVIDGLEAAEMDFNGKWNKDGATDNIKSSNDFMKEVVDVDSMSKVHGKDLRQIVERNSENPCNALQNPSSGWKDSNLKKTADTTSSDLQQNPSVWKTKTYVDWPDKPEAGDNWRGYSGGKSELPEETGWGESNVNKSVNNKNWNASLSAQGLSITGTEIWDQTSADTKGSGDTGNDWTAQDKSGNEDSRWDSVRQYENSNWGTSLSSSGSMRNKQNLSYDENAWLRRSLKQLVDMGFKEADSEKALKSNNMSLEGAIGQLLATQGTPSLKQSSITTLLPSEFNVNAESTSSQTDNNEDVTKLKRSQQQNLMSQNLAPEALKYTDEPSTDPSKTSAYVVPSVTSTSVSETARLPASTDQRSLEYLKESDDLRSDKIATSGNMCIPGNQDNLRSLSSTGSSGVSNVPAVQTSLPVVYQQQLLQQQQQQQQQQVQMQQLRFAHASRLMRNSLASQPVILLQQLAQLRIVQQQLATQQQLLQKQPQTNSMQVQQVAVQQQQIAAMMQQIQQQLLQQQLQQQTQQQLTSGQFSTPQQEALLNAQPQLQQLLLQRKQQQQQQLSQQHRKQTPLNHQAELSDESKDISSRSNFSKEAVSSLVQAVNSAPASPSTGKSRLGQWTQNSIQPERTSPNLPDGGSARNNLRSSPQPDSSLLISRSTNSPSSSQTSSSSVPGHRVIDPVSSRWGIDAAPKLSAEPPEFKPGVPWKSLQGKDDMVGDTSLTSSKIVDWSSSSNQTVSSAFVPITTRNNIPSLNPSSNSQNFSQANQAAIWPTSVSRNTTSQKQNSLSSNIRPPPGLGNDNSFHNISNVHSRSNNDSSWGSRNESQINNTSQFGIRTPGLQTWSNERREVGWPGTSGQPLESQPSVARVGSDLRDLSILGETIIDGNGVTVGSKPGLPSSYSNISTWLVMRNVNPRLDSNALRTLCQQHGRLLTFRLNSRNGNCLLRYDNKDEAAKAHGNLNGLPIAGLRLSVDFASDSDIGSFFDQNSDWTWPNAHASLPKTQTITEWPASKPLLPPANFSSELWSYSQAGGLASGSGVWSAAPSTRLDAEQSTGMPENGLTSPSMVTFLPPGLLNSSESN